MYYWCDFFLAIFDRLNRIAYKLLVVIFHGSQDSLEVCQFVAFIEKKGTFFKKPSLLYSIKVATAILVFS